jgi:hypothetical protein
MFRKPIALSPERHKDLLFTLNAGYQFAAQEMLSPVVSSEIKEVSREYVVVFGKDKAAPPFALLGTEEQTNNYVTGSGHWQARYVPAHIRRYPFVAGKSDDDSEAGQRLYTMVDLEAPHLSKDMGEPFFTADGQATGLLKRVNGVLKNLHTEMERSRRQVQKLDEAGVLVDQVIRVKRAEGESGLTGFRVVSAEALAAVDGPTLQDLNKTGALLLAYAHMVSLTNLKDGVLAKPPRPEAQAPADEPTPPPDDTGDLVFDFDS